MIFQNPMTCLNPVYTIGNQLVEALRAHDKKISAEEAQKRAMEMTVSIKQSIGMEEKVRMVFPTQIFHYFFQQLTILLTTFVA